MMNGSKLSVPGTRGTKEVLSRVGNQQQPQHLILFVFLEEQMALFNGIQWY
jgi:hypothetical protein